MLAQAGGNPLALIELAKTIADDPDAGRGWAAEALPLAGQLTAIMSANYAALPPATRSALLIAAAADSPDATASAPPGLIRLDGRGPQFTHPLARSAVHHAAPFAARAAAHLQVAEALRGQPDRYAWHLAAAALDPDERVASLLEDSAAQAQRRGGAAAAARALERAAELSSSDQDRARRLLAAADRASSAGQANWVRDLAGRVLTLTSDRTCASPPGGMSAGRCCGRTATPTRSRRCCRWPARHPWAGRPSRGTPRGWPPRSPTRPAFPRFAPERRPLSMPSIAPTRRCRRVWAGPPAAWTGTASGSRPAPIRSANGPKRSRSSSGPPTAPSPTRARRARRPGSWTRPSWR